MAPLKFGAQIRIVATTWPEIRAVAETLDVGRWYSAWTYDHMLPPFTGRREADSIFEGWSVLAGLAAVTSRLRLGTLVTCITFRNPALLAKMAATVDQMSDGRLEFGIGTGGGHPREHVAYGHLTPSRKERHDRLDEACEIFTRLFAAEGPVDYRGRYYQLESAPFAPKCVQSPHPPILIAGGGERRTLRTLARFGDAMNYYGTPEQVQAKIAVLAERCAEVGRDPAEIRKTVPLYVALEDDQAKADALRQRYRSTLRTDDADRYLPIGPADRIVDVMRQYQAAGADEIILSNLPNNSRVYERLNAEVLPAFD